jgi:hypothetical protein
MPIQWHWIGISHISGHMRAPGVISLAPAGARPTVSKPPPFPQPIVIRWLRAECVRGQSLPGTEIGGSVLSDCVTGGKQTSCSESQLPQLIVLPYLLAPQLTPHSLTRTSKSWLIYPPSNEMQNCMLDTFCHYNAGGLADSLSTTLHVTWEALLFSLASLLWRLVLNHNVHLVSQWHLPAHECTPCCSACCTPCCIPCCYLPDQMLLTTTPAGVCVTVDAESVTYVHMQPYHARPSYLLVSSP